MGLAKHLLTFLIVVLSLSSLCTNSLHDDHELDNNYFQEEYGFNFRYYPSYFSPIEGIKFDNSSVKTEGRFSDHRRLAASVKTTNVLNFGAKGDGSTDDTKVSGN